MIRLILVIAAIVSVSVAHAGVFTGDWLELIDTTKLPILRDDVTLQTSSYDRTGGNDDGFSGNTAFLRKEGDAFVIFEDDGPGCVYRIWSANPGQRRIEFYFDGEATPRLAFDSWEDMFKGKVKPFIPPVSVQEIGGWTSYVPMPYEKSLKIITRERVNFYQVTYQKFKDGKGVKTFSPTLDSVQQEKFDRVCAAWKVPGVHPWPEAIKSTKDFSETLPASNGSDAKPVNLAKLSGTGTLHALELTFDSSAFTPNMLRQIVLHISAGKGEALVDVPLGDFFLQGFPGGGSQSLLAGSQKDAPTSFYSYWPMPYSKGLTVELVNDSKHAIGVTAKLGFAKQSRHSQDIAQFHAMWRRQNPTTPNQLYPILDAKGRGHWCGISAAMQGFGPGLGFLEGDEMLWLDDRDHTYWNGTGSEDYYDGGWYFGRTGTFPYFGCGYINDPEGRVHAYRLHMTDFAVFQHTARIGIEHGHANSVQADYAGTVFWYAAKDAETVLPMKLAVKDRMWNALSLPGVKEAEMAMIKGESGGTIVDDYDTHIHFSGGKAIRAGQAPETVKLDVESAADDIYELIVLAAGDRTHVIVDAGKLLQTEVMLPGEKGGAKEVSVGELRLAPGKHRLELASWFAPMIVDAYKLVPSMKAPGAFEAEALQSSASGGATVSRTDFTQRKCSGDSYVSIEGGNGGAAAFTLKAEWNTRYVIAVRLMRNALGGRVQFELDGKPLGKPLDCSARREEWIPPIELGITERISAGDHVLTAKFVGAPAGGKGQLGIDYFTIAPDGVYEGERLKVLKASGAQPNVQDMKAWAGTWSGDAQMWFTPGSADAETTFEIDVPIADERNVCAFFTKAPDYGMYQLLVDGQPLGAPFDGYAPGVVRSEGVEFGKFKFTKGAHTIAFRCVGKNKTSSSFMLGLDNIVLE
jgi:hypothetical protein